MPEFTQKAPKMLTNPDLLWDGKTEYRGDKRALEKPTAWNVEVTATSGPSPEVIHLPGKPSGFSLELAYRIGHIKFSQRIPRLPAGTHHAEINFESHLTWGTDDYTPGWLVELTDGEEIHVSSIHWITREKGPQPFAVKITNPTPLTNPTLHFVYFTKWADVNGSVKLHALNLVADATLPVTSTLNLGPVQPLPDVTPQPQQPTPQQPTPEPNTETTLALIWLRALRTACDQTIAHIEAKQAK